ncbi:MAG: septum formation protein Maf [Ignavibacteriae bacterium]|nr:MAG: septum formation protein Maf [Ignavibacteriota bacterium]
MKDRIILASSSPRREYLLNGVLKNFGLKFQIIPANIIESVHPGKSFDKTVKDLAREKAEEVASRESGLIIAADTIVVLNNNVLGKPENEDDAKRILKLLRGNDHEVFTGIAFIDTKTNRIVEDFEVTKVRFRNMSDSEIDFYVKSGSPMDKAGAYGIQDDFGSTFVESINGDYFNIVGLPVVKTYLHLKELLNLEL